MNKLINLHSPNSNTNEIIQDLKSGNQHLLSFVYDVIFPACAKYIKDNNGSLNDARDIFQEALIVLYKNIRKANFELTCTLKTYLYAIVRNLWLKQLDKSKRSQQIFNVENLSSSFIFDSSKEEILQKEDTEYNHLTLNMVIQDLKEDAKYIITNYYYEKKSLKLIAKEMGYSEAYIRVKKNRVMNKLKQAILNQKLAA